MRVAEDIADVDDDYTVQQDLEALHVSLTVVSLLLRVCILPCPGRGVVGCRADHTHAHGNDRRQGIDEHHSRRAPLSRVAQSIDGPDHQEAYGIGVRFFKASHHSVDGAIGKNSRRLAHAINPFGYLEPDCVRRPCPLPHLRRIGWVGCDKRDYRRLGAHCVDIDIAPLRPAGCVAQIVGSPDLQEVRSVGQAGAIRGADTIPDGDRAVYTHLVPHEIHIGHSIPRPRLRRTGRRRQRAGRRRYRRRGPVHLDIRGVAPPARVARVIQRPYSKGVDAFAQVRGSVGVGIAHVDRCAPVKLHLVGDSIGHRGPRPCGFSQVRSRRHYLEICRRVWSRQVHVDAAYCRIGLVFIAEPVVSQHRELVRAGRGERGLVGVHVADIGKLTIVHLHLVPHCSVRGAPAPCLWRLVGHRGRLKRQHGRRRRGLVIHRARRQ